MDAEIVQSELRKNRLKKNSGDIPVSMILCSDGFAAYYEKYKYVGLEKEQRESRFYEQVENDGLRKIYKKLRELEASDCECVAFPRFKQSDDATAVYVKFDRTHLWFNGKIHRFFGLCQSMKMTIGVSKSVIITLVTALATVIYHCLLIWNNKVTLMFLLMVKQRNTI